MSNNVLILVDRLVADDRLIVKLYGALPVEARRRFDSEVDAHIDTNTQILKQINHATETLTGADSAA